MGQNFYVYRVVTNLVITTLGKWQGEMEAGLDQALWSVLKKNYAANRMLT